MFCSLLFQPSCSSLQPSSSPLPPCDEPIQVFPKSLENPFLIPIEYLEESQRHVLSPEVVADLELIESIQPNSTTKTGDSIEPLRCSPKPIYHHLFEPSGAFAKTILPKMATTFTTNKDFLKDSQTMIQNMADAPTEVVNKPYDENKLLQIWEDVVENPDFLEKYYYVEWEAMKYLNRSTAFLQVMSVVNGIVPMFNLLMTIFLAIVPLFVLKCSGMDICVSSYLECMERYGGKNQLFCKILSFMDPAQFSSQNAIVLLLMIGLYVYQIYSNVIHTFHFFEHLVTVQRNLKELKQFLAFSENRLNRFQEQNRSLKTYEPFLKENDKQLTSLKDLLQKLNSVSSVSQPSFIQACMELGSMGYHFSCYYHIYESVESQQVIQYCMFMNGYLDNVEHMAQWVRDGRVHFACLEAADVATAVPVVAVQEESNKSEDLVLFSSKKEDCLVREGKEGEEGEEGEGKDGEEEGEGEDQPVLQTPTPPKNSLKGMYYPGLLPLIKKGNEITKNDISMEDHTILTGPNASGKTTLLKTLAINFLLSQQMGLGCYDECVLAEPYHYIHSYLNIPDTSERDSLFEAETRRCKEILTKIEESETTQNHLCIFDELFSGTNPTDAIHSAFSFLKYVCEHHTNVDFALTTHYTDVCEKIDADCVVDAAKAAGELIKRCMKNRKMNVIEKDGGLVMTYQMVDGISKIQGAIHILENMGFPKEIVDNVRR